MIATNGTTRTQLSKVERKPKNEKYVLRPIARTRTA
jgi:hypothetical protein